MKRKPHIRTKRTTFHCLVHNSSALTKIVTHQPIARTWGPDPQSSFLNTMDGGLRNPYFCGFKAADV